MPDGYQAPRLHHLSVPQPSCRWNYPLPGAPGPRGDSIVDIAMCRDTDCPSKLKCYRFMAFPDPVRQAYIDPRRPLADKHCNYYIKADCCATSIREWGPGNYRGEVAECIFCNRPHEWSGLVWKATS